jgi:5-formyltetrahydrofolate cyclo-ligase
VAGRYGIAVPPESEATIEPDIVLVPLLAFDRRYCRLGYGGGFYDRTLAELRARRPILAIGLAYALQEVPILPAASFDQPLDAVATELGVFGPGLFGNGLG